MKVSAVKVIAMKQFKNLSIAKIGIIHYAYQGLLQIKFVTRCFTRGKNYFEVANLLINLPTRSIFKKQKGKAGNKCVQSSFHCKTKI